MLPSANDNETTMVVKIVPVNGHVLVNGQPQMKHIDMLAEIIISTELSKLSAKTSKRELLAVTKTDNDDDKTVQVKILN